MIEYSVLGRVEVRRDGQAVQIRGRMPRLILSLLLTSANRRVSTDRLVDALWGGESRDSSAHTLQVHVSGLRKLLEPGHEPRKPWSVVETVESGYLLRVEDGSLDLDRFERLADAGRRLLALGDNRGAAESLREALGLVRGSPFGDLASDPSLVPEAARIEERCLGAFEDRIRADLGQGRHHAVIAELRDAVDTHPFRERLRGLLMTALYQAGRQEEALRTYRSLASALGNELGIEPGAEIRQLEERILLQDPALEPLPSRAGVETNVPLSMTSFVGRERELQDVDALAGTTRLLSFLGPGGMGKTRLALEAAVRVSGMFPGGVWLVELASLRDPSLVGQAVAEVLGIDQQPGRPLHATLADRLRDSNALLILDNCEHLIESAASLAEILLPVCPRLRMWATSREPLGVAGETHFVVHGLALGPADPASGSDGGDAVQLFVDRASAALADFRVTDDAAPVLAEICRRLDGIPLAIELAAARVTILSPSQIADGLDDRFRLLTTGSRLADARQRTLQGALDWSYDLLSEPEQGMLSRLAVFRGTFGLDAVKAVCGEALPESGDVVDLLGRLVSKSLVLAVPADTETRYELLNTVRIYASAKLAERGDESDALGRHQEWFVALVEEAGPKLRQADQLVWLKRLEADHDNLRALLERSLRGPDTTIPLRVAGSLTWFWFLHSHLAEGWDWLERLIARSGEAPDVLRVRVLIAAGQFAWEQSMDERAQKWLEEALDGARRIGSRTHAAWALAYLGLLAALEGRWDSGERLANEAFELFVATGNMSGVGFAMWTAAGAAYLGAREGGQASTEAAAELVTRIGDMLGPARQVGDRNFIGHLHWSLAIAACDIGDYSPAGAHLVDALTAFTKLGNKSCAGHTLDQAAWLALARGAPKRAARILAATEALRVGLGIPGHMFERRSWEDTRSRVVAELSPQELDEAWSDGSHMDLSQAVGYALSGLTD